MARITEEQSAEIFARVQTLIGDNPEITDGMITQTIEDAAEFICVYTNRATVPDDLIYTAGDLAIVKINRLGTEGENSRNEAGASFSFNDAPAHIFSLLNKRRIARVGGYNAVTDKKDSED